ncbi:lysM and putative peptidoglycan-binding domain-containing protein 3 isoform X1 [Glossina fuscipes]|uniref:LysM and putative peptidoglycan-binding domain-containing protein 3 isoform X1 n=1 Tax=Glossina fuscipes TaxID=7396 RepID=A0A9C5ZE47_9MUSC|nr:lysM and putative peptidoglycan-binding domain-containing protein 3 isoform X1 [Glossina fuscipes]
MLRNVRSYENADDMFSSTYLPHPFTRSSEVEDVLQMEILTRLSRNTVQRFDNSIEAKVEPGDTLQAIALRFHCSIADIKRLNKIDKENEIHAHKVVKIPVTVHNVLLDNFPIVHTSGNSSPEIVKNTAGSYNNDGSPGSSSGLSSLIRNPLQENEAILSEKLMVASVNASTAVSPSAINGRESVNINDIILKSTLKANISAICRGKDPDITANSHIDASAPLITDTLDDSTDVLNVHRIRGPSLRTINWSGSDCDMSWVCLFIFILILCFVIPLVYVVYIAEHVHHNVTAVSGSLTLQAGMINH